MGKGKHLLSVLSQRFNGKVFIIKVYSHKSYLSPRPKVLKHGGHQAISFLFYFLYFCVVCDVFKTCK